MSKQFYIPKKFSPKKLDQIDLMNEIIEEYIAQDFRLTVRQLYYQMVARGHVENTADSYNKVCEIVSDARLAGLMDWDAIEDRTRAFIRRNHYKSGKDVLDIAARAYHMDMWKGQEHRVFCIVEKEALAGVLEGVCNELDVPLLAARGYPSGTVLREFALSDIQPALKADQGIVILHLGDHDPSGIDMSRDLAERLYLFATGQGGKKLSGDLFQRIALNMDQVEEQQPPENPAKTTDARFKGYQQEFGDSSWELDALKPEYLAKLVRKHTMKHVDKVLWDHRKKEIEGVRKRIRKVAEDFDDSAA